MGVSLYHNHLLPPQEWEISTAETVGFTLSMFRFLLAFLLSVPVAIIFRRIPTVKSRHWYAVITGFLLIYYPFGNGVFHAFISSAVTYALMLRFRKHCGTLTWLFAFPYLIANHISQASGMAWKEGQLDFTGAQMVLTLKLIAVAMCYQDGARGDDSTLRSYARAKSLSSCPSLLEFYSYVFSAGNLLSGPFFEARDYFDYVARRGDWEESGERGSVPSPAAAGTYRFIKALACAWVWLTFTKYLPIQFTVDLLESSWWREETGVVLRLVLLWATVVVYRFKYYCVWGVGEAALIFCGMGFNGYDEKNGKAKWDRYISSRIRQVELNPSLADTPRHWNICTGLWLRHYVYERLTPVGRKPSFVNMMVTQLVSGVWHGVFAGYWLFFATSAFMFQASRVLYKYEQSWSPAFRNFPLWVLFKIISTALILDYAGSAFMVLSLPESMLVWRSVWFFGHAIIFVVMLVGAVMPPKGARKKEQALEAEVVDGAGGVQVAAGEKPKDE